MTAAILPRDFPFRREAGGKSEARKEDLEFRFYRRIIAAVCMLAARDAIRPPQNLPARHRWGARQFVQDQSDLYLALGVPYPRLERALARADGEAGHGR